MSHPMGNYHSNCNYELACFIMMKSGIFLLTSKDKSQKYNDKDSYQNAPQLCGEGGGVYTQTLIGPSCSNQVLSTAAIVITRRDYQSNMLAALIAALPPFNKRSTLQ